MRRPRRATALDTLEREDRALLALFGEIDCPRGRSLGERRARRTAERIVRHLAVREGALEEVADAGDDVPGVGLADQLAAGAAARRAFVGEGDRPLRGQPAPAFASGQEFDGPLSAVMALVRDQVTWERDVALPVIGRALEDGRLDLFADEGAAGHAPLLLHPGHLRWFERAPVVSRLHTWVTRRRGDMGAGRAG
jgi:hypothetical protein